MDAHTQKQAYNRAGTPPCQANKREPRIQSVKRDQGARREVGRDLSLMAGQQRLSLKE